MKDGVAVVTAKAAEDSELLRIPAASFHALMAEHPRVLAVLRPHAPRAHAPQDITTIALSELMTRDPLTCLPDTPLIEAARKMREIHVSCIIAAEDSVVKGILTTGDITSRAVAEGLALDTPVAQVMTADPITLPPTALVADVLHTMVEKGITHMPVVEAGKLVGILTQTDLTRFQATSSAALIQEIAAAPDTATLARIVRRIPELLVQLVAAQNPHQVVTRLITDIGDATTRRLLALAEAKLGPAPVPYLWLACGSQGRQEQTGVSDQDNCLILDDSATPPDDAYFAELAKFVSDGLDEAGYFYCPGDMMATAIRWRQPVRVWRDYFANWIAKPSPEAQMLASVMFDLRPIGGHFNLFADLQEETLAAASKNSIFVAHMVSNSLETPAAAGPVPGLCHRALGRAQEHHRPQAQRRGARHRPWPGLRAQGPPDGGQHPRAPSGRDRGRAVSATGGRDLIDAYDMIAQTRLEHQAAQIQRAKNRTTSWRRPTCRISNAATCATPSSSSKPCRTPPGRAAADI
jgi:CBS domain-containing protein